MSRQFDGARLNMNQIPYIPWKGKTFTQITSSIKRNTNKNNYSNGIRNMFLANPLNIYRREIVTAPATCNPRTSLSIDEFNRPGGSVINTASQNPNGLVNTIDDTLPNNTCEEPGTCFKFLSPSDNARRRLRSSGMIPKKFDTSRNNDQYYTSSNQYLVSRNRTFQQNQYNFIRQGNSTSKPGDSLSSGNIYSPNGLNHCQKYFVAADTSFKYQWIDSIYYDVAIPTGFYAVEDINKLFQNAMTANLHYYILDTTHNLNEQIIFNNSYSYNKNLIFLLNIDFNNDTNLVELQVTAANNTIFSTAIVMIPAGATWTTPTNTVVPGFQILNNIFKTAVGFNAGNYPSSVITSPVSSSVQTILTNQTLTSSFTPGLQPLYVKLYYKPNNSQFAQQGAVSSSSLIARVKYDTITNAAVKIKGAFGNAAANALAYGVPENGYTIKSRMGYPMKSTPIFSKNGAVTCQTVAKVVHF